VSIIITNVKKKKHLALFAMLLLTFSGLMSVIALGPSVVHAFGPGLDGSVTSSGWGGTASATLRTTSASDLIVVYNINRGMNGLSVKDTANLFWQERIQGGDNYGTLEEWFACSPNALSSDVIQINEDASGGWVEVAFAISGASCGSPFDTKLFNPVTGFDVSGTSTSPSVSVSMASTSAIIIGALHTQCSPTITVGSGFTLIGTANVDCGMGGAVEYKVVGSSQSALSVPFTLSSGEGWSEIADVVVGTGQTGILSAPLNTNSWYNERVYAPRASQVLFINQTNYKLEFPLISPTGGSLHGGFPISYGVAGFKLNFTRQMTTDYCKEAGTLSCWWVEWPQDGGTSFHWQNLPGWRVLYSDANSLVLFSQRLEGASFNLADNQTFTFYKSQPWFYWQVDAKFIAPQTSNDQFQIGETWAPVGGSLVAQQFANGTVGNSILSTVNMPASDVQKTKWWFGIKDTAKTLNSSIGMVALWENPPFSDFTTSGGNEWQFSPPYHNTNGGETIQRPVGTLYSFGSAIYPQYADQATGSSPPWYTNIQNLAKQMWVNYGQNIGYSRVPAMGSPCLLYTSPSPRDLSTSRMPSSA